MTRHAAPSSFHSLPIPSSQVEHGVNYVKNLAQSDFRCVSTSRRLFADLLWRAFPSPSERHLADKAGAVLDVSPRQVINWLRCDNTAAMHYFLAVAAIAGAELVFRDRGRG